MRYVKSETLKFRHTAVGRLWYISPLVSAVLALVLTNKYFGIDNYCWWYTALLPGFLPMVCGLIIQKDKKMGNRSVVSLPADLSKCWRAKTVTGLLFLLLSNFCIVLLGALGAGLIERMGITLLARVSILQGIAGAVILTVTFAWQVPLWLWLSQKVGVFVSMLAGIAANMLGFILFALEDTWFLVPLAIPARLMIPVLHVLPNGLLAEEGSVTFTPELLNPDVIGKGCLICIVLFFVLELITEVWFKRQEAK